MPSKVALVAIVTLDDVHVNFEMLVDLHKSMCCLQNVFDVHPKSGQSVQCEVMVPSEVSLPNSSLRNIPEVSMKSAKSLLNIPSLTMDKKLYFRVPR